MSVGAFFDNVMWLAFGIYAVYLSKAKKEKLGNKATLLLVCGIGLIIFAAAMTLVELFGK